MARRYDSSTTTFSPEGRLHQVRDRTFFLVLSSLFHDCDDVFSLQKSATGILTYYVVFTPAFVFIFTV